MPYIDEKRSLSYLNRAVSRIVLVFSCFLAGSSSAVITGLEIEPSSPMTNDSVTITVNGFFTDGCWSVTDNSIVWEQNVFRIDVWANDGCVPPCVCLQVIVPYRFRYNVDTLEAGTYTVEVTEHHSSLRDPWPDRSSITFEVDATAVWEPESQELPTSFTLSQNYPNPFNPETQVKFSLPRASFVTLDVFNIEGRRVRRLVNQRLSAGSKAVTWDSRDDNGFQVSSGIYLYRITAGDFTESRKMILLK